LQGREFDNDVNEIIGRMVEEFTAVRDRGTAGGCCPVRPRPGASLSSIEELEKLLRDCRVVFLNLYSPMCPYCELFQPIFTRVGSKYLGAAAFVKIDVWRFPEVAWSLGISSTPATVVFVDGRPVDALVGYVPPHVFEHFVLRILRRSRCLAEEEAA